MSNATIALPRASIAAAVAALEQALPALRRAGEAEGAAALRRFAEEMAQGLASRPSPAQRGASGWTEERKQRQRAHVARLKSEGKFLGTISRLRSPERVAMLREKYPSETPISVILEAFNTLPGAAATRQQLRDLANQLGLHRPKLAGRPDLSGHQDKMTPERAAKMRALWPTPMPTTEVIAAVVAEPGPPCTAETVYGWAKRLDLPTARSWARRSDRQVGSLAQRERRARDLLAEGMDPLEVSQKAPLKLSAVKALATVLATAAPAQAVPAPAPPPAPPPHEPPGPEVVEAKLAAAHARAKELLGKGTAEHIVAMHTKLPLREVLRLKAELREEKRTQAA